MWLLNVVIGRTEDDDETPKYAQIYRMAKKKGWEVLI